MTDPLPLEAQVDRTRNGYLVTLPARSQAVRVSKRVVVGERVVVRRATIPGKKQIDVTLRRERLRLDLHGDLQANQGEAGSTFAR